ncbi:MAG: ABC transporter permease, partial [bacterium]
MIKDSPASLLVIEGKAAVRRLLSHWRYALSAAACLAIGTGLTAAIVGVCDAAFRAAPRGVRNPSELRRVYSNHEGSELARASHETMSYPVFGELARNDAMLQPMAAYWTTSLSLDDKGEARDVPSALVSARYFEALGVPLVGHSFGGAGSSMADRDDRSVVVGEAFRARYFDDDVSALGHSIRVSGVDLTIVGVVANDFAGIDSKPVEIWLPVALATELGLGDDALLYRAMYWLKVIGRRRGSGSDRIPTLELERIARGSGDGGSNAAPLFQLGPLSELAGPYGGKYRSMLLWVGGGAVVLFLVCCANIASLAITRAAERHQELGIRVCLGASRATA